MCVLDNRHLQVQGKSWNVGWIPLLAGANLSPEGSAVSVSAFYTLVLSEVLGLQPSTGREKNIILRLKEALLGS